MALNPMIPMAGNNPDIMGAFDRGQQAGARGNAIQQQNALASLYQTQGAGIAAGDQGALNALAAIDPMASLGVQGQRQTMQANQQRMDMLTREEQRVIQQQAASLSAAERAAEAQRIEQGVAMGLGAQTPEQWDAIMQQQAPDLVGQFANREMLANRFMSIADVLKRQDGPELPGAVQTLQWRAQQAGLRPGTPEYQDFIAKNGGGTTNNINVGSEVGTIPPGYELFTDQVTGARSLRPIAGGPVDRELADAAAASQRAAQSAAQNEQTRGDVVLQTTAGIREMLDKGGLFNLPEVGVIGSNLTKVNQEAADMSGMLDTLKGMVAFDRLQKLQQASATGASGLGQVTEREIALLAAQMGALDQNLSAPLIRQTLDTIESVFSRLSPAAQAYLMGQADSLPTGQAPATPQQAQGVPAGVDPGVWEFMTPEEKALFQ